jgi:DNA primase
VAIADEDVAAVRAATDLVELVGQHVALKRQGRRWVGLCPFHQEKTPSFSVSAEAGLYHCFGCGASGDAISFLRQLENLEFSEAVERLAQRAGIQLRRVASKGTEARRRRAEAVLAQAADFYHQALVASPEAEVARRYLASRGVGPEEIDRFYLGWAPNDWDACCRGLQLSPELALETGLGFVNRAGRLQDRFRSRVVFPVYDLAGRVVGFGGRLVGSADPEAPKYLNSPETALYQKKRLLYGLNWAKDAIVKRGEVVVCEGYFDVIAFARSGVEWAVATCGTSLGEDHLNSLRHFARRLVLAFDADQAGLAAAERVYAWERSHDLDVYVADLPEGADPADLWPGDADRLQDAVSKARPYLAFRLDRLLRGADISTLEQRAKLAEAAVAMVAEHPSHIVASQYLMEVADRLRVDPADLQRSLAALRRPRRPRSRSRTFGDYQEPSSAIPSQDVASKLEQEALAFAIARPDLVVGRLHPALFASGVAKEAFVALSNAETLDEAVDQASELAGQLICRLATQDDEPAPDAVGLLVIDAARRAHARLARRHPADQEEAKTLAEEASWLRLALEALREDPLNLEVEAALVSWLASQETE